MYNLHLSGFKCDIYISTCCKCAITNYISFQRGFNFIQTWTGGHTLSGACIEPRSLEELFPNWREMGVCTSIKNSHKGTYFFPYGFLHFLIAARGNNL